MNSLQDLRLFHKGLANDDAAKSPSLLRDVSVLAFQLFNSFRLPVKHGPSGREVLLINGPRQARLATECSDLTYVHLFIGGSTASKGNVGRSPLACMGCFALVRLWCHVVMKIRHGLRPRHIGHYFEFCTLIQALRLGVYERVSAFGHYDRYSTWLGGICQEFQIAFRIIQHGALSARAIPHRIECQEVLCFNEDEEELFRQFVVQNPNCHFNYRRPVGIQFSQGSFPWRPVVAIASQVGYSSRTRDLVAFLDSCLRGATILIYLHHLEKGGDFQQSSHGNHILVESFARFYNVDFLITCFSSIVYDYLYCEQFQGTIICWLVPGIRMGFYSNNRVRSITSLEELKHSLPLNSEF